MLKVSAVVPTCRSFIVPEQTIHVDWIIVHDREERPIEGDAQHIIAPDSSLFGKCCDSIRSAGFLAAYKNGAELILTVDDDTEIPPKWAQHHVEALTRELHPWWATHPKVRMRGMPYKAKSSKVAISHGLWDGVPDLDATTQRDNPDLRIKNAGVWQRIAAPFAQSAMNLGFRREVACVMYQPAQGEGFMFDRFSDIFCGVLAQRCLSLHGYSFLNGGALVTHNRASNLEANLRKEAPGILEHETFWEHIWRWNGKRHSLAATYHALAEHVKQFLPVEEVHEVYFEQLGDNMQRWLRELGEAV